MRAWQAAEEARLQAEIQAIHMQVGRPTCFFVMGRRNEDAMRRQGPGPRQQPHHT